jgi:signal transduction histidine kinase/DNA-binding response OmpR family regulator
MGTKSEGVYKASPVNAAQTKYHLTHFTANKEQPGCLTSNQIYSLLQDRQGRIWIGSFDSGLFLVQEKNRDVKFIHTGAPFTYYPRQSFQKIRHMCLDQQGNIWIATTDGLLIMEANDQQAGNYMYRSYTKVPGDPNSLGNNNIQFIYQDSKNRMWLSTSGGGLDLAIGANPLKSLSFADYTIKDGLPNDYLLSCTEDKAGNLWIATENGLSRFNPQAKTFRNYDSYDGLPKAGFSEASVTKLPGGEIGYGTTSGFISFVPETIGIHRIQGNIVFSGLQVNNVDVSPSINKDISADNINYAAGLKLKYNQDIITIEYSLLDYRSTKQAFAYRLVGFDNSWHSDRQFRRVTFTNLPPGNYVFEVKSLSTDLYSNLPYRRLAITILPPFWKTWWAYLIYVVLAVLFIETIRRTVTTMIRLRNKIAVEQKVAELKLRFFTNVSHELRTPLTLIMNPLEQLFLKEKLSSQGTAWVEVAHKNASRMIRFINQLLDIRKLQTNTAKMNVSRVEILAFIKRIEEHFEDALQKNDLKLQILCEQKQLYITTDAEKLDVILYNLLSNAVKFSPHLKIITIRVKQLEDQRIEVSVSDQGPGVEKEKLAEIFELYYEGDLNSQKGLKGTGIGLALAKELVEFLGGTIRATNNESGGLTVHLQLSAISSFSEQDANGATISFHDKLEKTTEQKLLNSYVQTPQHPDREAPLVLLVEDNPELNEFLNGQLSEYYRVEVAMDGREGLEKALTIVPDLIISDIMMPVMDGLQMLEKLKSQQETSHIPVVLLTAKHSVESQLEGLSYGADAYITKPFNNQLLIASVNNLLRQRKLLFEGMVLKKKTVDLSPGDVIITSKDETFLKEVIKAVEEKMSDPEFNIEIIAEAMSMSRTTFYKKFKSLADFTPVEFVREMRLQRAKQLLDAGGNNISEIAYEVGFNNPKYFSTCFKEKYQVTPSDYQKANVNYNHLTN